MRILKELFIERCPKCKKALETHHSKPLKAVVIKSCPDNHYQKEFHPAFETFIENHRVS